MPTIVLQMLATKPIGHGKSKVIDRTDSVSVSASPGRYHYATIDGVPRTFERVGTDASGNEVYREQRWRRR